MAIKKWHRGKLLILWSWGAAIAGALVFAVVFMPAEKFVIGSVILVAAGAIPLALSVVTWCWLSGKEEP